MALRSPRLSNKRLTRMKKLIDWLEEKKDELRFESLSDFAALRGVSYDTVKQDAYVLAYASIPGPRGYNLTDIPRSHRADVKKVRNTMRAGLLHILKARKASEIFLEHAPDIDVERLNMIYRIDDPMVKRQQKMITNILRKIMEEKESLGVHKVRAYSSAWNSVGEKIHYEIKKALGIGAGRDLDPVVKDMVKDIWHANMHRAQAQGEYEGFRVDYLKKLSEMGAKRPLRMDRPKGEWLPATTPAFLVGRTGFVWNPEEAEKVWKRFVSDYKNLRRHHRPAAVRAIPRNLRQSLIWIADLPPSERQRLSRDPFFGLLVKSGERLSHANSLYSKSKRIEEEKIRPIFEKHLEMAKRRARR
jgi:hypothetical protein